MATTPTYKIDLEFLRKDFQENDRHRESFKHFFCPILRRDEDVSLCEGHVVNDVFENAYSPVVMQRADVDSFYGSHFEADFINMMRTSGKELEDIFDDKNLYKFLKPKVVIDGKAHQTYLYQDGHKAKEDIVFDMELQKGNRVKLAVKGVDSQKLRNKDYEQLSIGVNKSVILCSFVSLLKAAHLSMFFMCGYSYGLSAGSYFIGRQLLGQFYLDNVDKPKSEVIQSARTFFKDYVNMVRPFEIIPDGLYATIEDHQFISIAGTSGRAFAIGLKIRTGPLFSLVILPFFADHNAVETYLDFIRTADRQIVAKLIRWDSEKKTYEIVQDPLLLHWPNVCNEFALES